MSFEVYTFFGRVLATFKIGENETHHIAAEKARQALLQYQKNGTVCWIRLKR